MTKSNCNHVRTFIFGFYDINSKLVMVKKQVYEKVRLKELWIDLVR